MTQYAKIGAAIAWNESIKNTLDTLGVTEQAYNSMMAQLSKRVPKAAEKLVKDMKERSAKVLARLKVS